ncbi:MAG: O-antigen ligase family protein, partial [Candidatus Helarchaeota archaeon]
DLIMRTYLLIYRFMSILALSGIIDWIWHKQLQLFLMIFRSEASLDFYPRVSGFMMWPNQFAVLLDVAIIISFILRKYSKIGKKEFFINTIFMLTAISLSGSRNAWLSLSFGFLLAWLFKIVNIKKLLTIGAVWTLIMLSFPVPAIRLGIKNCHFIPLSNIIITFRPDSSLSRQLISQKKTAMAIELWSEHPVTGIGWRGFSFIFEKKYKIPFQNIDNLALTILSELGIGGMILSLFLFYFLIRGTKWSIPLISIPLLLFLISQILDCFIHDITFMSIYLFFLACLRCFKNEKLN